MPKTIRTFNASEEVNEIIDSEAPKGRGFSEWVNEKIVKATLSEKNEPPKSPQFIVKKVHIP